MTLAGTPAAVLCGGMFLSTTLPAGLVIRAATAADRGAAIRLLTAQLVEHDLPVDDDGVARGVELCLQQGSSAWLVMAFAHGMPVGILLANPIVSVEKVSMTPGSPTAT